MSHVRVVRTILQCGNCGDLKSIDSHVHINTFGRGTVVLGAFEEYMIKLWSNSHQGPCEVVKRYRLV